MGDWLEVHGRLQKSSAQRHNDHRIHCKSPPVGAGNKKTASGHSLRRVDRHRHCGNVCFRRDLIQGAFECRAAILRLFDYRRHSRIKNLGKMKRAISPKKILFNPILISFALGVLLFVLPFRIPVFFSEILTTISAMNAPIAMLTVGAYLAQVSIKEMFTRRDGYFASAIRLVAVPVATAFLLWILPFGSAEIKRTTMILAAAPIGSNVAVYAQLYGGDYKKAVQEVVLSTVLSVATMPLVIGMFEMIL